MSAVPEARMTVDAYLVWAEGRPGRHELIDGVVHAISPERAIHAEINANIYVALRNQILARGLPCHALPDGMTVRISDTTAYEPAALVYCGAKLAPSALEVPSPVIVVEVLSPTKILAPTTRRIDSGPKLAGYFTVPSLHHYLVVDPDQPLVIHHARGNGDHILTRPRRAGAITLDPPGLELSLSEIYAA